MSINLMGKNELANNRKIVSDFKNNTDSLTFEDSKLFNEKGKAYSAVRNIQDDKLMASLENICNKEYFEELYNSLEVE